MIKSGKAYRKRQESDKHLQEWKQLHEDKNKYFSKTTNFYKYQQTRKRNDTYVVYPSQRGWGGVHIHMYTP